MWCRIASPGAPWMSCGMTGHSAPDCSGSPTTARWRDRQAALARAARHAAGAAVGAEATGAEYADPRGGGAGGCAQDLETTAELPATSPSITEHMKAIVAVRSRQRHLPLARRRQRRHQVLRTTLRACTNYFRFDPELGHIAATQQPTRTRWLGHPWLVDPWQVYSACMVLTKSTNPNCVAHPLNCKLLLRYRCQSSSSAGRKMQG